MMSRTWELGRRCPHWLIMLAVLASGAGTAPLGAQQDQPASREIVTPELLLREFGRVAPPPANPAWVPGRGEIVLSAFDAGSGDEPSGVWIQVVDVATGAQRRLVRGTQPVPAPDGSAIAYLAGTDGAAQIWTVAPAGDAVSRLTSVPGGLGEPVGYAWSPDSRHIAFSFRPADTAAVGAAAAQPDEVRTSALVIGGTGHAPPDTEIWVADAATGEAHRVYAGRQRIVNLGWRSDGSGLVFSAYNYLEYRDDRSFGDVRLVSLTDGSVTVLVRDQGVQLMRPVPAPAGDLVAFTSFPANLPYPEFWNIAVVPATGGPTRTLTRDLFVASPPAWAPGGERIYFTARLGAFNQLFSVTTGGSLRQLTDAPRSASAPRISPDDGRIAWLTRDALGHQSLRVADADGGNERVVREFARNVDRLARSRVEAVSWRSTDGLEIAGFLVWPLNHEPGRRYPLLVDVHGGPVGGLSLNGSILLSSPLEWHMWAARGFAVLVPDYRSSAIYGWAEVERARERQDANERDFDDIMSGIDHVIARGLADPERLALIGHSYGGYLTNWILTQTGRFRAAVSYEGYADNYLAYGSGFTTGGNRVFEWLFGGLPWQVPDHYRRNSPSEFVQGVTTPTLFISGDEGLPVFHNEFLFTAWRQQGIPAELVVYRSEGHVVLRPENQRDLLFRILDWIESRLP
jgi:dipeptidyl aminopeptidase/acylaminoacyl peptidase